MCSQFFDACIFSDRWLQDFSSSEVLTDGLAYKLGIIQSSDLASSINSTEFGTYCQARDDYPVQEKMLGSASKSMLISGVQPIEGVGSTVDQNSTQGVRPL